MANVELKTDFKDGEVLFGEQLNNNFKAIKAALEAANKIAWQDNLDDEVVAFKGTTEEINRRAIINGQLLYDIEKGISYIDVVDPNVIKPLGKERIKLSGGGEGIAVIDGGDYADIIEEGIYLIKSNKVTDKLNPMSGTINQNYNKLMYVLNSGGSASPNVKQVLMDGFDFYIRTVYLNGMSSDGTLSAYSATAWEKRTIGEGGTGGETVTVDSLPVGTVIEFEGDTIPDGWVKDDKMDVCSASFSENHTISESDTEETINLDTTIISALGFPAEGGDIFEGPSLIHSVSKKAIVTASYITNGLEIIQTVRINAFVNFQTVTAGVKYLMIKVNGETVAQSATYLDNRGTLVVPDIIMSVPQGSVITLVVLGTKGDVIRRNPVFGRLTVEMIDEELIPANPALPVNEGGNE